MANLSNSCARINSAISRSTSDAISSKDGAEVLIVGSGGIGALSILTVRPSTSALPSFTMSDTRSDTLSGKTCIGFCCSWRDTSRLMSLRLLLLLRRPPPLTWVVGSSPTPPPPKKKGSGVLKPPCITPENPPALNVGSGVLKPPCTTT